MPPAARDIPSDNTLWQPAYEPGLQSGSYAFHPHVGHQGFRNDQGAVGLLVVLNNRDKRAPHSESGAV